MKNTTVYNVDIRFFKPIKVFFFWHIDILSAFKTELAIVKEVLSVRLILFAYNGIKIYNEADVVQEDKYNYIIYGNKTFEVER